MAVDWSSQRGPYEPITYWGRLAVDATLILTLLHVASMVLAVPLFATDRGDWLVPLVFTSGSLPFENPWALLTYPFVHNIASEGLWFAVGLFFFFHFGREVERFIGRNALLALYGLLVVMPALLCWALQALTGSFALAGSSSIHFSIFAAFTFIYPGVSFFFNLQARFVFWIFFVVYSLIHVASRNWVGLAQFWSCVGTAYVFLKYIGVGSENPVSRFFENLRLRRAERHSAKHLKAVQKQHKQTQNIDTILEKISRAGMQSLNEEERRDLEKASRRLQERDSLRR
jgi:hypothetical protein